MDNTGFSRVYIAEGQIFVLKQLTDTHKLNPQLLVKIAKLYFKRWDKVRGEEHFLYCMSFCVGVYADETSRNMFNTSFYFIGAIYSKKSFC